MAVYSAVGLVLSLLVCSKCNLLALEDKTARSLGVNVNGARLLISAIAVLLASISTAELSRADSSAYRKAAGRL